MDAVSSLDSKQDQRFKVFLEAAPDAIVVVDSEGRIVMVNRLAERMFGFRRDELMGQRVEILVPERVKHAHEGHRSGYVRELRTRPMGAGRELAGRRKDGSEFPIEISLSPLETETEEKLVISIIRDIGPRKQLEAKFRGLLESAPDGIVVVDIHGKIVIVNGQAEKLFDYAKDELLGQPIEILVPDSVKHGHFKYRDGYISKPVVRPMGAGRRLTGRKKDGREFPVEISLSPLETEQGTLITSIVRDITERRREEDEVKATLREKEALLVEKEALLTEKESLLKEIHHRVKNNLQVTSSLLRLQSDYIQDEHARSLFAESQNRIRSMALVHEKLYRSQDLSRINFYEYTTSLAQLLFRSYGVNTNLIKLEMEGAPVYLSIESAVPCGLIVNELLSNCLKHAFPDKRTGTISIKISNDPMGHIVLIVSDDGVGLPHGFNFEKSETLGLQLVRTLVKQLNSAISVRSDHGTRYELVIPRALGSTSHA
jgi:PAS domain S-box-containing protein